MSNSHATFGPQVTTSNPPPVAQPEIHEAEIVPVEGEVAPLQKPLPRRKPNAAVSRNVLEYIAGADALSELQKATVQAGQRRRVQSPIGGTVALICRGLDCKFLGYCDLHKANIALPIDKPCPLEQHMVDSWRDDFLASIDFDETSEHSATIRSMVDELTGILVLQSRIAQDTAKDGSIERSMNIGFNFQGAPIETTKLYPGFDQLIRLANMKLKILANLIATPKAKAETGRLESNDPGTKTSTVHAAVAKIRAGGPNAPQMTGKKLEIPIFTDGV